MHLRNRIDPRTSEDTLEQNLIFLIGGNNEESLENIEAIENIFGNQPDLLFANNWENSCFYYAKDQNILDLLSLLFQEYCSDKIAASEWDKLVECTLAKARYFVKISEFEESIKMYEYALFYLVKVGGKVLADSKLEIQKECASVCVNNFESSKETEIEDIDDIEILNQNKYVLQQIIVLLKDIFQQTGSPTDEDLLNKHTYYYVTTQYQLAKWFKKNGDIQAVVPGKLRTNEGGDFEYAMNSRIEAKYRFAHMHALQAKVVIENLRYLEMKQEAVEKQKDIEEFINQVASEHQAVSSLIKKPYTNSINSLPQYLTNQLCEIVSNPNTREQEVIDFIDEHKIDIDKFNDASQAMQSSDDLSILYESSAIEYTTLTGNLTVLEVLIKRYGANFSLFKTNKREGIVLNLNDFSSPDMLEFMFDPAQPFYQRHPERQFLEFFLDVMAGRLHKVKTYLELNPDCICDYIKSGYGNEEPQLIFILTLAYKFKHLHVIRYLENYIKIYIEDSHALRHLQKLEKLFFMAESFNNVYGRTEPNRKRIDDILDKMLEIIMNNLRDLRNIPIHELTNNHRNSIARLQLDIVVVYLKKVVQITLDGDRATHKAYEYYVQARAIHLKNQNRFNNIDQNYLEKPTYYVEKIQNAICILRSNIEDKLYQARKKYINEVENLQDSMVDSGSDHGSDLYDDEQTETIENNSPTAITHLNGSFGNASNMFQNVEVKPDDVKPESSEHKKANIAARMI